jgi:nucleotide-binding universal stress UspA family protein
MINSEKNFNKNILVAVDESENARRAVSYVGQFLAVVKGFKVLILHVIRHPEKDYTPTSSEKDQWFDQYKLKVDAMLKDYRQILIRAGFAPEDVSIRSTLRYCPSLAECILAERDQTGYSNKSRFYRY